MMLSKSNHNLGKHLRGVIISKTGLEGLQRPNPSFCVPFQLALLPDKKGNPEHHFINDHRPKPPGYRVRKGGELRTNHHASTTVQQSQLPRQRSEFFRRFLSRFLNYCEDQPERWSFFKWIIIKEPDQEYPEKFTPLTSSPRIRYLSLAENTPQKQVQY